MASFQKQKARTKYNWDGLVGLNVGRIIYVVLTVAVALQQFEATEPAAPSLFLLTMATMFLAERAWVKWGHKTVPGIRAFLIVNALGLLVQAALIIFGWEMLVAVDDFFRILRTLVGRGDHLLPMRCVWILATIATVIHILKYGFIRWPNKWVVTYW